MNDELKDQRIGNLRAALIATRDSLWSQGGFDKFASQLDRILKDDDKLAEQAPVLTGEQLRELAASHREKAIKLFLSTVPAAHTETARAFIEELVAAAGYEAEGRIRLRENP